MVYMCVRARVCVCVCVCVCMYASYSSSMHVHRAQTNPIRNVNIINNKQLGATYVHTFV